MTEPVPGTELAALRGAERLLAEIVTAADAVEVVRLAEAARVYAQQTRRGTTAINLAVIIKLRAAVRLADLVDAGQEAGEIAAPGKPAVNPRGSGVIPATLDEIGVNDRRLAEYRKLRDGYSAADLAGLQVHAAEIDEVLSWSDLVRRLGPGPHVGHNAGESEWYTPAEYIAAAVEVLGAIDLDPASTEEANAVVGAERIYTAAEDGLDPARPWAGRLFLNPPYAQPAVALFALRLAGEFTAGNVTAAITLTNNATETAWWQTLAAGASAVCFPLGRVKFWHPDREAVPLQGQSLLYLGPYPGQFAKAFAPFGRVWSDG
jgi:hypothetical protein